MGRERLVELDGLRGVAAMMVVISHIVCAFFPHLYFGIEPGVEPSIAPSWQTWFATSPLYVSINGSFAVYVFFVLSGYVIAQSADRRKSSLPMTMAARYVRLALPCGASVILAGLLIRAGFQCPPAAIELVGHSWIKGLSVDASWSQIWLYASGLFFWTGESPVNGVVWSMRCEIVGSFAIYVIFWAVRGDTARLWACVIITIVIHRFSLEPMHYACFAIGAAFYLSRFALNRAHPMVGPTLLLAGLFFGGKPFWDAAPGPIYAPVIHLMQILHLGSYIPTLGASLIVCGALTWAPFAQVLRRPICQFLGRISFGVYLTHMPLVGGLLAPLYALFGHTSALAMSICLATFGAVLLPLAFVFTVAIDEPSQSLSASVKSFRRSLLSDAEPAAP